MKTIAVITGASSGIGKQFVRLLRKEPKIDEIWAIARDQEKLQELKKKAGRKIITYSLDLSKASAIAEYEHILKEKTPNIKYLVNSAGFISSISLLRRPFSRCRIRMYTVPAKALRDAKKNKDISVYGIHTKLLHVAAKILPQRMAMKIWLMQQNL